MVVYLSFMSCLIVHSEIQHVHLVHVREQLTLRDHEVTVEDMHMRSKK